MVVDVELLLLFPAVVPDGMIRRGDVGRRREYPGQLILKIPNLHDALELDRLIVCRYRIK